MNLKSWVAIYFLNLRSNIAKYSLLCFVEKLVIESLEYLEMAV